MYTANAQGSMVHTGFSPSSWGNYHLFAGDWNGDGKTDIALVPSR